VIRAYRESDRRVLKEITARTFAAVSIDRSLEERFGLVGGRNWEERKLSQIDADCDGNPAGVFVHEEGGQVVGFVTVALDRRTNQGRIMNLAVDVGQQGKGIGRRLIEHALEYMRDEGLELARIETLVDNDVGRHLYPKLGFEEVARQIYYARRL
jgi:ribosomal protein S18 acetylase RimI-like enzyme